MVDFASSIVSAVIGGAISSSVITYLLGARRAEREVLRGKLEGLYTEISKDIRHMHVTAHELASEVNKIDNKCELSKRVKADSDSSEKLQPQTDKYNTVINIYFPDAVSAYEKYFSIYQEINSIRFGAELDFVIDPENAPPRHGEIMVKVEELTRRASELRSALLYEADKINRSFVSRLFLEKRTNQNF